MKRYFATAAAIVGVMTVGSPAIAQDRTGPTQEQLDNRVFAEFQRLWLKDYSRPLSVNLKPTIVDIAQTYCELRDMGKTEDEWYSIVEDVAIRNSKNSVISARYILDVNLTAGVAGAIHYCPEYLIR